MGIRVVLADDHTIMRQGLRSLLEPERDIEVVGEARDGGEALHRAGELAPDVVVMDLTMPEMNGIEATRRIRAAHPAVKVLALSMLLDRTCVLDALRAGALGFVLKDCAIEELVRAIRTVSEGAPYLCGPIASLVIDEFTRDSCDPGGGGVLSRREQEVLQLVADGRSTKEIAFLLGVSIKTIEAQRTNVMKKLNLRSVADLTKYALRQGMTTLGCSALPAG